MNRNLYVITPIFNPFRFASRYRLYSQFAKRMAQDGVKLFTVEAAFGTAPFEVTTPHEPMNLQLRTNQILWHKERMINLAMDALIHHVPDAQFLGWFDSDVAFLNPTWLDDTIHALGHLDILQPFADSIYLSSQNEYMWNCPSTIRFFLEKRGYHQTPPLDSRYTFCGHPGLAWCATRHALERMGGLYERCVAGSGDTIMANSFKGDWSVSLPAPPSAGMKASMAEWARRCGDLKLGFVHGSVAHYWHGKSESRGYEKRWAILAYHQFDPVIDTVIDPATHLYKWAGNKPKLEEDVRLSLGSRNEDEI